MFVQKFKKKCINRKMFKRAFYILSLIFLFFIYGAQPLFAEVIKKIQILGNERIPEATIKALSSIQINQEINETDLNNITKNLYESNFFENITLSIKKDTLIISVKENPIIGKIEISGIKSNTIKKDLNDKLTLKSRSSYNKLLLKEDKENIINQLRDLGYYSSNVDILIEKKSKNIIDIVYDINLGEKAKIKKITFTGDKVFKDSKLKSIIISEEYKPWKFISGKKYLNENTISIDNRLLKNFYLNKGYYFAKINSSFAKAIDEESFELVFNIDANEKYYFNDLELELPIEYQKVNYEKIYNLFSSYKNKPYSINKISKILETLDEITSNEQFESTKSFVDEEFVENKINLKFIIEETEKIYIKKINIFGNNVTRENVIRNQFVLDEGDPFNEILMGKTINNIKSLNFFKNVNYKIMDYEEEKLKEINIYVEERPTGEIMAGAGFGTSGATTTFGVKENNYLGKGVSLNANATINESSIKGKFSFRNPNYNNTDKSIYGSLQSQETDKLSDFGYKTNKTGISFGTGFEIYDDLNASFGLESLYEVIDTDSSASALQKKQKGNYFDNFLDLSFNYDKRNQKFQTSEGFRNTFNSSIPLFSETGTFSNSFSSTNYIEFFDKNILRSSVFFSSANSIKGENIKLSERINIPSSKLRGFEFGKTGPKDGNDYIGGNFVSSINISSTLPQLLENSQTTEFNIFLDIANVWGVDYNSSLDNSNDIKSAIGIGFDWFTVVGPMSFSLSQAITKSDTDVEETFRFNIGTTF